MSSDRCRRPSFREVVAVGVAGVAGSVGGFLAQRTQAPDPAPDSMAIVSVEPEAGAYTRHYFDSRGVVRVYAMTFDGEVWQLLHEEEDFSPLSFRQRFTGRLSADGDGLRADVPQEPLR